MPCDAAEGYRVERNEAIAHRPARLRAHTCGRCRARMRSQLLEIHLFEERSEPRIAAQRIVRRRRQDTDRKKGRSRLYHAPAKRTPRPPRRDWRRSWPPGSLRLRLGLRGGIYASARPTPRERDPRVGAASVRFGDATAVVEAGARDGHDGSAAKSTDLYAAGRDLAGCNRHRRKGAVSPTWPRSQTRKPLARLRRYSTEDVRA